MCICGPLFRQLGLWTPNDERSASADAHCELSRRSVDAHIVPGLVVGDARISVLEKVNCQQVLPARHDERPLDLSLNASDAIDWRDAHCRNSRRPLPQITQLVRQALSQLDRRPPAGAISIRPPTAPLRVGGSRRGIAALSAKRTNKNAPAGAPNVFRIDVADLRWQDGRIALPILPR